MADMLVMALDSLKKTDPRLRVGKLHFGSENIGIQPSASNSSELTAAIRCRYCANQAFGQVRGEAVAEVAGETHFPRQVRFWQLI